MKRRWLILLILLPLLIALFEGVDFIAGYTIYRDVSYGDLDCEVMDVLIPQQAYDRATNGCVLLIHGGSWMGGDKADEELMSRYIADNGYIAASINYRLFGTDEAYHVEKVLDEIDLALQSLVEFAAKKGIVIDRAATYGYSAGAHLSMLYSYSRGGEAPIPICFTANMAGPADLDPEIWGADKANQIAQILSGGTVTEEMLASGEVKRLLDAFSPVSYINSNTPASIFAYGGVDTVVPIGNGESIKARFDMAGAKYDYVFFPNSDHSLIDNFGKRLKFSSLLIEYCGEYFN